MLLNKFKTRLPKRKKAEGEKKLIPKWRRYLRKGVWAVCLTGILTCFFVALAFAWFAFIYLDDEFDLATVDSALNYTSVVYAVKDGEYQQAETLPTSENRVWTNIDEIPKNLQNAFIAIEDKRFYQHSGVDIKRTLHAVLNLFNPFSNETFGGSTITQQVIKNITGDDQQTISRKVQEIRRAWYVEREYKKDQILEVYLNTIYLSQGCFGVQTAAEVYFSKDLSELSLLECASLASITKYPTKYDPIQNPENNLERAKNVINAMRDQKLITAEEAEAAKNAKLELHVGESSDETTGTINSYFVDQVTNDVINALVNEKGYSEAYARSLVFSGGIQIYSTMDLDVQSSIDNYYKKASNFPGITSPKYDEKLQSAMVVIDNATGAIVGMVGGIGEKTTARGLNRATQSYRQPGSCMKPIGTYGPAVEYKATIDGVRIAPGMLLKDEKYRDDSKGNPWPKNYDSISEKMMTVQAGLNLSKNTIAVKVVNAVGPRTSFNFIKNNLGVSSLVAGSGNDENDQAMALGGLTKGISVKEITAAYAAFPTGGTYVKPYTFTKVCDQNGRVLLENRVESNKAMEKETAAIINKMLQQAAELGTGTTANWRGTPMAGKTGTTSDDKDRWFVGYTAYYTAGVWVGYDKPDTVIYDGANPAAVAFKNVMRNVHSGLAYKAFEAPTGLTPVTICAVSGKLCSPQCTSPTVNQFFADSVPTAICDVCGQPQTLPDGTVLDPNTGLPVPADPNAPVTPVDPADPANPVNPTPGTPVVPAPETPPAPTPETPVTPTPPPAVTPEPQQQQNVA